TSAQACGDEVRESVFGAGATGGSMGSAGAPSSSSSAPSGTGGAASSVGGGGVAQSSGVAGAAGSFDAGMDATDPCAPTCGPVELCDADHLGLDDDCNGVVDEGCACMPGQAH